MFIATGGLPKLADILKNFSHRQRPGLTILVLEIVHVVLLAKFRTPMSCFAGLLTRAGFLEKLADRYLELTSEQDVATLDLLCTVIELFSTVEAYDKWQISEITFIERIFLRARLGGRPPLSEHSQLCVFRAFQNVSKDVKLVKLLWQSRLIEYLAQYLDTRRPGFEMNALLSTAFATVFYLARIVNQDTIGRLAPFIPAMIHILSRESPMKVFATTLFIECVSNHSTDPDMARELEASRAIDALVLLLKIHSRKDLVIGALVQWCSREPVMIQTELLKRKSDVEEALTQFFATEPLDNLAAATRSLQVVFDKCPLLTTELSQSRIVGVLINTLLNKDLRELPELRMAALNLIISFYEATETPKRLIAKFRMLNVAQKMIGDSSVAVRMVAQQLQQAVASNYIF
jgi:hypothetical protein